MSIAARTFQLSSLPTAALNALNAGSFARIRRRSATQIVIEINHALFPWYPNRYARRMTHPCSLAGGAPGLQSVSAKREWPNACRTLSLTEAMVFPCSQAHTQGL